MFATRDWPVAAGLALVAVAAFAGRAAGDAPLLWIGGAALLAGFVLLGLRGAPSGVLALLPLAGLVAWCAASISWSTLPDRSWDYADRTLVYLAFALLGLWLAGRTRELAAGLAVVLGAVVVWSLLGKVVPSLYPDYARTARLRGPVGLWNQLALLGDFALPLALWAGCRRRNVGALLAFAWLVALLLTYSRGGLAVAVVVVAAWLAFSNERADGLATLVAAVLPAGAVVGLAFALPGITSDGQSGHVRSHDGLIFGVLLLAGAAVAAALTRLPRPRGGPALRRALQLAGGLVLATLAALAAVKAGSAWRDFTSSGSVGNTGGRFGSAGSNFRWVWWEQAWHGFQHHLWAGTGAGTFQLTNLLYRHSYLDVTTEPHDVPLQFLSETGIVGGVLFALAVLALLGASLRRGGSESGGARLALSLVLPAYLLHSFVDIDWDFVAVSAPAFLVAGALAGREIAGRRRSSYGLLLASGAALAAFGALLLPWLGHRYTAQALDASIGRPSHAVALARRARAVDPLLVEPLWWQAAALDLQGKPRRAFALYAEATRKQPANPAAWHLAGQFAFEKRCYQTAYTYLEKFTELDPYVAPWEGGDMYNAALRKVNRGQGNC